MTFGQAFDRERSKLVQQGELRRLLGCYDGWDQGGSGQRRLDPGCRRCTDDRLMGQIGACQECVGLPVLVPDHHRAMEPDLLISADHGRSGLRRSVSP